MRLIGAITTGGTRTSPDRRAFAFRGRTTPRFAPATVGARHRSCGAHDPAASASHALQSSAVELSPGRSGRTGSWQRALECLRCLMTAAICSVSTCRRPSGCGGGASIRGWPSRPPVGRGRCDPTRLTLAAALRSRRAVCLRPRLDRRARPEPRLPPRAHAARARRRPLAAEGKMVMYALTEEGRALLGAVLPPPPSATAEQGRCLSRARR